MRTVRKDGPKCQELTSDDGRSHEAGLAAHLKNPGGMKVVSAPSMTPTSRRPMLRQSDIRMATAGCADCAGRSDRRWRMTLPGAAAAA
jgi:hypothetical protein